MSLSPSTREFCPLLFQKALDWVGEETDLTPSTKWLACGYYAVVFNKTKVFLIVIILRWKVHPQKTINGKRNFKRSLSFPFVDKRNQFLTKLFFVELNLVFCLVERLACFWNNQCTQRGYFIRIFKWLGWSNGGKNPWKFQQTPPLIPLRIPEPWKL